MCPNHRPRPKSFATTLSPTIRTGTVEPDVKPSCAARASQDGHAKLQKDGHAFLDSGDSRPGRSQHQRLYSVPKRIGNTSISCHELLRNPDFWEVATGAPAQRSLPDADVLMLYHARTVLTREWREMLFKPPNPAGQQCLGLGANGKCVHHSGQARTAFWQSYFIVEGHVEKGTLDPIGDVEEPKRVLFDAPSKLWYRSYLREQRAAWDETKVK